MVVQFGFRLLRSPPLSLAKRLRIESHLALEHRVDGTGQPLGQAGSGLAFGMFFLQAGEGLLRGWMVSEEQHGSFRKGPLEMGVADFGP